MITSENIKTIADAKSFLRSNFKDGCFCPACGQIVKLYKRKIHFSMSRALIALYKLDQQHGTSLDSYFHISNFLETGVGHDFTLFAHYGMVELKKEDDENKKTSGMWRILPKGISFVEGLIKVPSHVFLFNNKRQGFSDVLISIQESIGDKFNYKELMEG